MFVLLLVAVLIGAMDSAPCPDYAGHLMDNEAPRVLRRLNTLRGLSHEQVEQILTRGA